MKVETPLIVKRIEDNGGLCTLGIIDSYREQDYGCNKTFRNFMADWIKNWHDCTLEEALIAADYYISQIIIYGE